MISKEIDQAGASMMKVWGNKRGNKSKRGKSLVLFAIFVSISSICGLQSCRRNDPPKPENAQAAKQATTVPAPASNTSPPERIGDRLQLVAREQKEEINERK